MEYPFKDLMPLDEVLEREGYYKDWTHLDPEVFYSLTQISEYIKTKGYGVDVRLLIAQLAEHFGLKTTQVVDLANLLSTKHDALKDQFDVVIRDATSGADWGGEIVLARGGKPTLQARLDDTTAQLAEKAQLSDVSSIRNQLNGLVLDSGASDAEVAQARVNGFGSTFPTLNERINNIENIASRNIEIVSPAWEQGYMGADGNNLDATTRIRTDFLRLANTQIKIVLAEGYKYTLVEYDENFTKIKDSGYSTVLSQELYLTSPYVRIILAKIGDTTITPSDGVAFKIEREFKPTDKIVWVNSYFNNGVVTNSNLRIRTLEPIFKNSDTDTAIVTAGSGYRFAVIGFGTAGELEFDSGWLTMTTVPNDLTYYVQVKRTDNGNINPAEGVGNIKITRTKEKVSGRVYTGKIDFTFVRGIAHRGVTAIDDAENTLESLENSFYAGAKIVEIDVRRCASGEYVLLHDSKIDRTSNGTGWITQYTLDELRGFDFGYEGGTKLPRYDYPILIPTLEEYLMKAKEFGIQVCIDFIIEDIHILPVFQIVEKCRMRENVYWHVGTLSKMRTLLALDNRATILLGLSVFPTDFKDILALQTSNNQLGVTTQWTNFQRSNPLLESNLTNLRFALDKGLIVHAYTVNSYQIVNAPTVIEDMRGYGISGIGTDELLIEPNRRIISAIKSA